MLIDLLKLAPAAFVGACIACGAQEITGWQYGFVVGLGSFAYCMHLMHAVTAQHVRRVILAELATKKQNEAAEGAGGQKP
jgi:hypothetical protein